MIYSSDSEYFSYVVKNVTNQLKYQMNTKCNKMAQILNIPVCYKLRRSSFHIDFILLMNKAISSSYMNDVKVDCVASSGSYCVIDDALIIVVIHSYEELCLHSAWQSPFLWLPHSNSVLEKGCCK